MADERQLRKLFNTKQDVVEFNGSPSISGISDGQVAVAKSNNKQLAVYRKKYGKLWKSYMSYDGSQYVDRNIIVKNNVVYNGYLTNSHYPSFSAYISASADAQTVASGTNTRVNFDSEDYDVGSNFDASAYKFTAPVNGIYHFNAKILWDNDTDTDAGDWTAEDRHDIAFFKNDGNATPSNANNRVASRLKTVSGTISDYLVMNSISTDLKLDAGDYIEVVVYQNSGVEQHTYDPNDGEWTQWNGHLITAI